MKQNILTAVVVLFGIGALVYLGKSATATMPEEAVKLDAAIVQTLHVMSSEMQERDAALDSLRSRVTQLEEELYDGILPDWTEYRDALHRAEARWDTLHMRVRALEDARP